MQSRQLLALASALVSLAILAACGSSSSSKTSPSSPVFTSVPVTAATQSVAYTYQLAAVDPAGGSVTFSLTTAPTGTAFSGGGTITWIPTAAQSRVSNSFAVTAATASGGTAQQSWTVTPGGTITVNWQDNYWGASGVDPVPESSSEALNITALVNNPDGSITVEKSSATAPGVFSIPNVPGGYYWLDIGAVGYWTSTNTFDAGHDYAGEPTPFTGTLNITDFDFNLSGLESVPESTFLELTFPIMSSPPNFAVDSANSTSYIGPGIGVASTIDWSQITSAFLMQYVPTSLGPPSDTINNLVLGNALSATGISLTAGATNIITETLQPSPSASFDLTVDGASQWSALLTNAAPATPTPLSSALLLSAQQFVTGINASGTPLTLVETAPLSDGFPILNTVTCDATSFSVNSNPAQPAITADQDFGTLQYGDPFPSAWTRALSLCQEYTVPIPAGSGATANFALVNSVTVPVSAITPASLAPLVGPVTVPTINGASFFTAATMNTTTVPLSWNPPTTTTSNPYGYLVHAFVQASAAGVATYRAAGTFYTAQTSIVLPPLAGGNTYVFAITTRGDATANVEKTPFRSTLPTGTATVVSAPITISSGALMPAIHGDRRVITRLSQPQPAVKGH